MNISESVTRTEPLIDLNQILVGTDQKARYVSDFLRRFHANPYNSSNIHLPSILSHYTSTLTSLTPYVINELRLSGQNPSDEQYEAIKYLNGCHLVINYFTTLNQPEPPATSPLLRIRYLVDEMGSFNAARRHFEDLLTENPYNESARQTMNQFVERMIENSNQTLVELSKNEEQIIAALKNYKATKNCLMQNPQIENANRYIEEYDIKIAELESKLSPETTGSAEIRPELSSDTPSVDASQISGIPNPSVESNSESSITHEIDNYFSEEYRQQTEEVPNQRLTVVPTTPEPILNDSMSFYNPEYSPCLFTPGIRNELWGHETGDLPFEFPNLDNSMEINYE